MARRLAFLADENVAPRVVRVLRDHGYDVADIKERGLFRPPAHHHGIVIIRFSNVAPQVVGERLLAALQPRLLKRLPGSVVLLTDNAATIVH